MNVTAWLDVAIGLGLVYLGVSLFVTVINEYIAQALNLRGKQLYESLKKLIDDPEIRKTLAKNPGLKPFFDSEPKIAASYIDPNVLARLLVGGLAVASSAGDSVKSISKAIDKMNDSALRTQLQAIVRTAGDNTSSLVMTVSDWVDRSLTMLGENYKRNLQVISFAVGLAVAGALNLHTLSLVGQLYRDKEARDSTVALAVQVTEKTGKEAFDKCLALPADQRKKETACTQLNGLVDAVQGRNADLGKLPIGWGAPQASPQPLVSWISADVWLWGSRTLGWVLTALAVSLGAPFWFELLNKFVNVRHGMRRPEVQEDKERK